MRLNNNFQPCVIGEAEFLIPIGTAVIDVSSLLDLNEVGAYIIDQIKEKDCTKEELIQMIYQEFDADIDQIRADLEHFIEKGQRVGFLEE